MTSMKVILTNLLQNPLRNQDLNQHPNPLQNRLRILRPNLLQNPLPNQHLHPFEYRLRGAADGVHGADPRVVETVCVELSAIFDAQGAVRLTLENSFVETSTIELLRNDSRWTCRTFKLKRHNRASARGPYGLLCPRFRSWWHCNIEYKEI